MLSETRGRVWDPDNSKWRDKCPNFLVCKQGQWPTSDTCCDCTIGGGLGHCSIVEAAADCCICLETEQAHVLLPCGHQIGVKCVRKSLYPEPPYPEPTLQDYGCPDFTQEDGDYDDAAEQEWSDEHKSAADQWDLHWDVWEDCRYYHEKEMSKMVETCPMCRASTGMGKGCGGLTPAEQVRFATLMMYAHTMYEATQAH